MDLQPELKFQIDIEFDKWACNSAVFYNSILKGHPYLEKGKDLDSEAKKAFNDAYVDEYYKTHAEELRNTVEKMRGDWSRVYHLF